MTDATLNYNPHANISVVRIGHEQSPLIVIDDFVTAPELLLEYAQTGEGFHNAQSDFYPGVQKKLPALYATIVHNWVIKYLAETAQLPLISHASISFCALSVANQDPDSLLPIQRIPHFDTCNSQQWAMVHYLCDESFGGTGFFRHISSGFECIIPQRQKRYQRLLEDEASTKGLPQPGYLQGNSELFKMIYTVPLKYNRALLYPSNLLHSGLIQQWQSKCPWAGRLTANSFCQITG
ncbi:MAG: hypothetical protein ACJA13_003439 [Paraglaciecola sp.]